MTQRWIGICREYDPEGVLVATYPAVEMIYGPGGRKLEEIHLTRDGRPDFRYEYRYDADGLQVEKRMVLGTDWYHGTWRYLYRDGRLSSKAWVNRAGAVEVEQVFEVAEDGLSAHAVRPDIGEWDYRWDEGGRVVEVVGYGYSDGIVTRTSYEYDRAGHVVRMEHSGLERRVIDFAPGGEGDGIGQRGGGGVSTDGEQGGSGR